MYTRDRVMHIKRLFYVASYFMHMKIGVLTEVFNGVLLNPAFLSKTI
jgi:hypothetical protein